MTERSFDPSDEEVHADLMEQLLLGIHVAMPGRIQSYDPVHQVADIVLQVRHRYPDPDGTGQYLDEDYPVLPAVPILWPRMGKWFWAASVEAGDAVQVLFNSSALGIWRRSTATDALSGLDRAIRGVSTVGDVGRHSLTHAVALLGMETYSQALAHAPPFIPADRPSAGLALGSDIDDGTRQRFKGDGAVVVEHGTHPVFRIEPEPPPPPLPATPTPPPSPDFVALAAKVDAVFASLQSVFDSWTPVPNDGGAALKTALAGWAVESVAALRVKAS